MFGSIHDNINCILYFNINIIYIIYFIFLDHVLLVTLSPATFQFELSVASKVSLKASVIITGRIREVAEPLFSLPTFTEVEKNNEEVTDPEIYTILAYYGCHLGPQFQLIKKIILGKKGKFHAVNIIFKYLVHIYIIFA